jgi:hypothetical protein
MFLIRKLRQKEKTRMFTKVLHLRIIMKIITKMTILLNLLRTKMKPQNHYPMSLYYLHFCKASKIKRSWKRFLQKKILMDRMRMTFKLKSFSHLLIKLFEIQSYYNFPLSQNEMSREKIVKIEELAQSSNYHLVNK